ncbi:hypothetical protein Tsubulata_027351 [Turnera subulata]|uniref:Thioredoxin domain-containing protein n=1 Tax=Turnera subulata TaxID=218843 RepID=A0A9Q0FCR9_9ROSI|nr:hypothetical protein Tsubulata_027351 [Turnera subulata]
MGSALSYFLGTAEAAAAEGPPSGNFAGVTAFHSSNRWQLHFNSAKDSPQLMVIDFAATWCGPCKFMEPVIQNLASKYTDVQFVKLDVDELPEVAQEYMVQGMPTFVLVKRGKEVDRVMGADQNDLERKVLKHRSSE